MLSITRFQFNMFEENTYLLVDTDTNKAAVIDPGMFFPEEIKAFDRYISEHHIQLEQIINTHLHLDHCFGADYVVTRYHASVTAHPDDAPLGKSLPEQNLRFGIKRPVQPLAIDIKLRDGDTINIGHSQLSVIHVPGHSPGGIALYSPEQNFVIVGDSLFKGSIGRTDLPGGNHSALIRSIKDRLLSLPDSTTVLSGHGEATTIGNERHHNPYLSH